METADFKREVIDRSYSTPVLVDFWAPWCGPCTILSPALELLHERHKGEWVLVKINADKNPELSVQYHVTAIPSVKLFINGKVVDEFSGALPGHVVEEWLKKALHHG